LPALSAARTSAKADDWANPIPTVAAVRMQMNDVLRMAFPSLVNCFGHDANSMDEFQGKNVFNFFACAGRGGGRI
jgi:hypothetical protein